MLRHCACVAVLLVACNRDPGLAGDGGPGGGHRRDGRAPGMLAFAEGPVSFGFGGGQPQLATSILAMAAGDFDENGTDDLIVASVTPAQSDGGFDHVTRLLVVTAGGHVESPPADCLRDLRVGRFNRARHLDVLVADCSPGRSRVHFGDGHGHFAPAADPVVTPTTARVVGDLNADGLDDIVLFGASVQLLLDDGDGHFHVVSEYRLAHAATTAFIVDLDGNQRLDVICGDNSGHAQALLGAGDGTFALLGEQALGKLPLVPGDFDGDGVVDLASGDVFAAGRGDGTFGAPSPTGLGAFLPTAAADFDRDGIADLAGVAADQPPRFRVAVSRAAGTFAAAVSFDAKPFQGTEAYQFTDLGIADFNGDHVPDIFGISGFFEGASVVTRIDTTP